MGHDTFTRVQGVPWAVAASSSTVLIAASDGARIHSTDLSMPPAHLPHPAPVTGAALSARGHVAATASVDGLVRIFLSNSSSPAALLGAAAPRAHSVHAALTADGRTVVAAFSESRFAGRIEVADWAEGAGVALTTPFGVGRVAVSDDARTISVEYYAPDSRGVRLLSRNGESRGTFPTTSGYFAAALDAAGESVAIADGAELVVHDIRTGERVECAEYVAPHAATVALSRCGTRVVAAVAMGGFGMWDATTGEKLREFEGHSAAPTGCTVADGFVVSCAFDRTVRMWSTEGEGRQEGVEEAARRRFAGRTRVGVREARDGILSAVAKCGCACDVPREEIDEIVEFAVQQSAREEEGGGGSVVEVEMFVRAVRQVVGFLRKCARRRSNWEIGSPGGKSDWKGSGG